MNHYNVYRNGHWQEGLPVALLVTLVCGPCYTKGDRLHHNHAVEGEEGIIHNGQLLGQSLPLPLPLGC